jgi:hypothetical protein
MQIYNNTIHSKNDFSRTNTTRNSSVFKTKPYETDINHAPKRKEILSSEEKNWHYAMPYGILNRNITLN